MILFKQNQNLNYKVNKKYMLHEFSFKKIKKSNNRNIYIYRIFERDQNRNYKKKRKKIETYQFNQLNMIANKIMKKKIFRKI